MGEGCTYSRVFRIWGHDWFLKLNPVDRNRYDEEFVSLGLELSAFSMEPYLQDVVEAYFILTMSIPDRYQSEKHIERRVRYIFHNGDGGTSSSKSCMIKLEALKTCGFFDSDNYVFGVKFIEVISKKAKTTSEVLSSGVKFNEDVTIRANTTSETLLVKYTSTLPETYTWSIADIFGMENPGFSPEFTAGGYKWSIRLDKEENNISLYLKKMTDDLPEYYAVLVELTLSNINQEGLLHLKRRARLQFSNDIRRWGWKNFVSMEDMQDSSDGYLIKTMCCIKAEVKIVGSSMVK